jgi:hypothetical protein
MRAIINGKTYNTDTAIRIAEIGSPANISSTDFAYEETHLYRTKKGRWFVAGHGGPRSQWATYLGNSSWGGGHGIRAITETEALELAEFHHSHDDIAEYFNLEEA